MSPRRLSRMRGVPAERRIRPSEGFGCSLRLRADVLPAAESGVGGFLPALGRSAARPAYLRDRPRHAGMERLVPVAGIEPAAS